MNVFEFANFSDLTQTLKDFSENLRRLLGRLLGKSFNAFYARRLPTKFAGRLPTKLAGSLLKSSA